jgi:hypothetical protein
MIIEKKQNIYAVLTGDLIKDEISNRWTEKQAEAIVYALLGVKQTAIAVELSLVQSTENKRLNGAGWNNLSQYLDNLEYRPGRRYC